MDGRTICHREAKRLQGNQGNKERKDAEREASDLSACLAVCCALTARALTIPTGCLCAPCVVPSISSPLLARCTLLLLLSLLLTVPLTGLRR